ncbi:hypothetical protein AKJ37_03245 [candidate division MSBL1 archaeon SCGC-AAA259I09]|uniref:Uncharacterized protein n=1 Tax=candidate division MSBL1 archaeon SCGC-AAA259I09 TaxID=1698267 RepID=A0A133USX9_9EURY|nr:hypothetical protein AKJ37_03245 [candidate division MSBL1 archaeon SCGC-AAA259I09]
MRVWAFGKPEKKKHYELPSEHFRLLPAERRKCCRLQRKLEKRKHLRILREDKGEEPGREDSNDSG